MHTIMYAFILTVLFLEIHGLFQDGCIFDKTLSNVETRDETNIHGGNGSFVSDDTLMLGWYSLAPGARLSTIPAQLKIGSCGTYFPIWINGTHPLNTGEEVIALACRKTFYEQCESPFSVMIKSCGTRYAYYLKNTPVISAYCIEFSRGCKFKTILPDSVRRGKSNLSKPGQQFVSDDAIVEGWYYVADGTRLATNASELKIGSCGTYFPIWLHGTHPSITGETFTVTACMKTYFDECDSPFPVKITNCGTQYVYYLKNTTVNSAFCIEETLERTSEKTTDAIAPPTSSAVIITTDLRGTTLPRPGNDTYLGDDSAKKIESIVETTTIVFSAVVLCPMTVLLVIFLLKLKNRKGRQIKVKFQEKEMPIFFIPMMDGWMKAEDKKVKLFTDPVVVTDLETEHCIRQNKEMK